LVLALEEAVADFFFASFFGLLVAFIAIAIICLSLRFFQFAPFSFHFFSLSLCNSLIFLEIVS
jgi:hypothetical protein